MKNKKRIIIWSSIVVILIILILPKLNLNNNGKEKGVEQKSMARSIGVNAIIIQTKPLQNKIFSNGTLISNEEVELRSEISGKIIGIFFAEGKRVKKDAVLLKINDSELQATLKKNKSKVVLAKDKEYRSKQLLEKNLISQQEYDLALGELISVLADVEFNEAQLEKTEIKAPFDGIIGLRSVSVGSYISPQVKIATLQNINPIKMDFSVPQKYFGLLKEGRQIFVKLSSPGKVYKGNIYAIEPKIDQNTRTVQVRALVPNVSGELTPGAYVEIEIILEEIKNAIMVPTEAIVPDIQGEKVFLYKGGTAVPQIVTPNIRTESEIQIINGLDVGDTLIISGIIQLRPNAPVKINVLN